MDTNEGITARLDALEILYRTIRDARDQARMLSASDMMWELDAMLDEIISEQEALQEAYEV